MTTYITEEDVMKVANDLEQIVTPNIVNQVLEHFDTEMSMDDRSLEFVIQDLINEFKTESYLILMN